jgi:hypothetical protein
MLQSPTRVAALQDNPPHRIRSAVKSAGLQRICRQRVTSKQKPPAIAIGRRLVFYLDGKAV